MAAPTVAEVRQTATEATIRPDINPTRTSSAAEKKAAALQAEVGKSPRAGTEEMAAVEPINPAKITKSQENYTFKKADGTADTTTYTTERNGEKNAVDEIVDFLDNGTYTPAVEQKILIDILKVSDIKKLLDTLQGGPIIPGTTVLNTEVKNSLKKIAENPIYQGQLRDALNGGLDGSSVSLSETIGAKERTFNEASRLVGKKGDELDRYNNPTTGELHVKTRQLRTEFTPSVPGALSTKADRISELETRSGRTTRELSLLQAAQNQDNGEIGRLRAQLTEARVAKASAADIKKIQDGIDILETGVRDRETIDINPRQMEVDELNRLHTERTELERAVNEILPQKIEQINQELVTLKEAKFAAQADKESAEKTYKQAVGDRVEMFQGMIGQEAGKFVRAEIAHAENVERTRLATAIAEAEAAGDKVKADILRSLEDRWDTDVLKGHRVLRWKAPDTRVEPDEAKVQPDLEVLLKDGREGLVKGLFKNPDGTLRKNPDTGRNYTSTEITEKMKDATFVSALGDEAAYRVLGKSLKLGLVNENNAIKILQSSWGPEMLTKARTWNKTVDEQLKEFEKTHNIPWNKILEESKKHKKLGIWLLLTLMFPIPGMMVGGGLLTKELFSKPPPPAA